jgi:hypothetical protein
MEASFVQVPVVKKTTHCLLLSLQLASALLLRAPITPGWGVSTSQQLRWWQGGWRKQHCR